MKVVKAVFSQLPPRIRGSSTNEKIRTASRRDWKEEYRKIASGRYLVEFLMSLETEVIAHPCIRNESRNCHKKLNSITRFCVFVASVFHKSNDTPATCNSTFLYTKVICVLSAKNSKTFGAICSTVVYFKRCFSFLLSSFEKCALYRIRYG